MQLQQTIKSFICPGEQIRNNNINRRRREKAERIFADYKKSN